MSITTTGFSESARTVDGYRRREALRLRESEAFGLDSRLRAELEEVWEECQQPNWDGHDAIRVSVETLRNVYQLLECLPIGLHVPTISAEADGHLTLEWYRTPKRLLSVSVTPDGELHYAGKFGPNRVFGTEAFFGELPSAILGLIKKVYA